MRPQLRDLLPFLALFRPYGWWIAAGLGLAVLTLSGSWGLLGLSGGFLTATGLAGLVPETALLFNVVVPAGGIRMLALIRVTSRWGERVVNHEATFRLLGQLRTWLYERFSRLSPRQLGLWHGAEVLNRLTRDVDQLDNLFIRLLVPIGASTVVLAVLVALCASLAPVLAWPAALLAVVGLVAVPLLVYLPGRVLSPRLVARQEGLRRSLLDLVEGLEEWSLHRPAWERQRDRVLKEDAARLDDQMAVQRLGSGARALVVALIGVAGWAFLGLAATLPKGQGPDGPWLVALTLLVLGTGEALLGLPAAWLELPGTARAARRLSDLAEQRPDPAFPTTATPLPPSFELSLDAVSFFYLPDQPVLIDVTQTLPEGTHVALLGPSGEGKTTLVRLLTRLEDPTAGVIRLGGRDLKEWAETELRSVISGSLQDPWIFTATIADNLRLAAPEADEVELWRVLEVVGLAPQVRAWPEGLGTWIEEGGQSLSGGQRRRLALARALLKRAKITVLDEPTEGLEAESAQALVEAIRRELAGQTLVWVTHRPEGLAGFPVVWTMRKGRISS